MSGVISAVVLERTQQKNLDAVSTPSYPSYSQMGGCEVVVHPTTTRRVTKKPTRFLVATTITTTNKNNTLTPLHIGPSWMKNSGRQRLVVLGAGWAAYRIIRDIDIEKYDLTVVSPRFVVWWWNSFFFSPFSSLTSFSCKKSLSLHPPSPFHYCGDP